jgi:hypothetical protein
MRHADAGYAEALDAAREGGLDLPSVGSGASAGLARDLAAEPASEA